MLETRKIGYAMIAHAVGYHGTATAMSRVLMSGHHNVYVGVLPGDRNEPVPFGELLMEMELSKRGGLVVGVRTPAGDEVINPPKDLRGAPGHSVALSRRAGAAGAARVEPPARSRTESGGGADRP